MPLLQPSEIQVASLFRSTDDLDCCALETESLLVLCVIDGHSLLIVLRYAVILLLRDLQMLRVSQFC